MVYASVSASEHQPAVSDEMRTRTFRVNGKQYATVVEAAKRSVPKDAPLNIPSREDWTRPVFEALGIKVENGMSITYVIHMNMLVVRAKPEVMGKVTAILSAAGVDTKVEPN